MRSSSANIEINQGLNEFWPMADSHKKHHDKNLGFSTSCDEDLTKNFAVDRSTIELSANLDRTVKLQNAWLPLLADIGEGLAFILVLTAFAALFSISDSLDAFIMGVR